MQWKSGEPSLSRAVHTVCLREPGKLVNSRMKTRKKPNLLANGVIKCYLSFLQYLHWQSFIRDLWPSVLQIYCICCGF